MPHFVMSDAVSLAHNQNLAITSKMFCQMIDESANEVEEQLAELPFLT